MLKICRIPETKEDEEKMLTSAGFVGCESYDELPGIILVSGIYRQ